MFSDHWPALESHVTLQGKQATMDRQLYFPLLILIQAIQSKVTKRNHFPFITEYGFFPFITILRFINFALKEKGKVFLDLNCRKCHL